MKNFVIIRVPVVIGERAAPARRPNFGPRPEIVGEADSLAEAASRVAELSFGDLRHHYYGLELVAMGAPDRKSAVLPGGPAKPGKPPKGGKPLLAVVNEAKKEKKA